MFNVQLLFPVFLLVIQTYVLLFGALYLMRRIGVLGVSYIELEVSQVIVASALLMSIFYISTADYGPLLQSFKSFLNRRENVYSLTFYRFGQYFLNILATEIVFIGLTLLNMKIFLGLKSGFLEIRNGNIPASLLIAAVVISFGILSQFLASEIINYLTPRVIIFN